MICTAGATLLHPELAQMNFSSSVPNDPIEATGYKIGVVLAVPFGVAFGLIGIFALAGFYHLFCLISRGAGGYVGTYRAIVYAWSPVAIINSIGSLVQLAVPAAGVPFMFLSLGAIIWAFGLLVIAFREIHELTGGMAFAVASIPTLIIAIVLFVLMAMLGIALLAALGGGSPGEGRSGAPSELLWWSMGAIRP
jgi:hypothetical protein